MDGIYVTKPCNSADRQIPASVSNWFAGGSFARFPARASTLSALSFLIIIPRHAAADCYCGARRCARDARMRISCTERERICIYIWREGGEREKDTECNARDNRPRKEAARACTLIVCARIIVVRANGILLHADEGEAAGGRLRTCVCTGLELNGLTSRGKLGDGNCISS